MLSVITVSIQALSFFPVPLFQKKTTLLGAILFLVPFCYCYWLMEWLKTLKALPRHDLGFRAVPLYANSGCLHRNSLWMRYGFRTNLEILFQLQKWLLNKYP